MLELFRQLVRELGQTVLMVTHDPVAASFADSVLFTAVIGFSAILLATRAALRGRPADAVGAGA